MTGLNVLQFVLHDDIIETERRGRIVCSLSGTMKKIERI